MEPGKSGAGLRATATEASGERKFILLLGVAASVHVFIFSAAFPFFNNVDEPAQFDLVVRYSHGHAPSGEEVTSREASILLALFCSCAYLGPAGGGQCPPPPWTLPPDQMKNAVAINSAGWQTTRNYESSEPPLYYLLAGAWWDIGKCLGFAPGRLMYWLRFSNIVFIVLLVWLCYAAANMVFSENRFARLAVPAVAAFMPQSAFYSIGNDVLSPICFGALFLCLMVWLRAENPSIFLGALCGVTFAATYLSKMTNLPLLAIAMAAIILMAARTRASNSIKGSLRALAAFCCCAAPPILAWMLWSKSSYGDLTGAKLKMEHFGWTLKPFSQWWHHPIFSSVGLWTYLSGQLSTFWQGEFEWYYPPRARARFCKEICVSGFLFCCCCNVPCSNGKVKRAGGELRALARAPCGRTVES
ncbi:MAG TPA: DUF2142 domain-containing protein, partial [Verrucomicrobiae bacterium]|nr:DUF2142 domain-containing protein [Verrucomicrobiae bacterium]